jgi:hypothetical protein
LKDWKTIKEAYAAASRLTAVTYKLQDAYNTINRRLLELGKDNVEYWGDKLRTAGGAHMGTRKRYSKKRKKTRRRRRKRKSKTIRKRRKRGRKTRRK